MGTLLDWVRNHIPAWKRADEKRRFDLMLSLVRSGVAQNHHPWYETNPWGVGLYHGKMYRLGSIEKVGAEGLRFFRVVLEFDPAELASWARAVTATPRDKWLDVVGGPKSWHWMIEELQRRSGGGLVYPMTPVPGSRRTLTQEILGQLDDKPWSPSDKSLSLKLRSRRR